MNQKLFNPEKISTIYSLMAAFLIIVEASLGAWLISSNSTFEKVMAGILITAIFLAFLYSIMRIQIPKDKRYEVTVDGLGKIKPADNPINESKLKDNIEDILISPDRSYVLNKPTDHWIIEELDFSDWVGQGMAVGDTELMNKMLGERIEINKVLVVRSKSENYLYPIPGETKIDGRNIPTALSVPVFLRLSIIPLIRRQAPLFVERPFIHNYNLVLSGILNLNVTTQIKEDVIENNNSKRIISVFKQKIENAEYNDKRYDEISSYHTLVGIEGINKDYVLILQYITTSKEEDFLSDELKYLQELINSFQPIQEVDSEKAKKEFNLKADEKFKSFIESRKSEIFFREFLFALMRIKDCDIEKNDDRGKLIKTLTPFKPLSKLLDIKYEELDDLWKALEECEKGDAKELKSVLPILLEVARLKDSEQKKLDNL